MPLRLTMRHDAFGLKPRRFFDRVGGSSFAVALLLLSAFRAAAAQSLQVCAYAPVCLRL